MNIIVPINRKRFPFLALLFFFLTILFAINLFYTTTENLVLGGIFNWIFNIIVLLIPLSYTILALCEYLKTRFDKNAMLELTETYLNDNLSIFSCGKILWSDISSVEIKRSLKTNILVIKLLDTKKYLAKKNFVQSYILKKYIKKWGSPIIISERRVVYDIEELKQIVLKHIN